MTEAADDGPLLARCRQGDQHAWRDVVRGHYDLVYRVARQIGIPEEEREDVCQETFTIVFRKADRFSGGKLAAWIYRIAANCALRRRRRRRVRNLLFGVFERQPQEPQGRPAAPDGALELREMEGLVLQVLDRMASKKREAFVLYELEGLTCDEVALRAGCSPATARTRIHYARRQFTEISRKLGLAAKLGAQGA